MVISRFMDTLMAGEATGRSESKSPLYSHFFEVDDTRTGETGALAFLPSVAQSWEWRDDSTVLRFSLTPGIFPHDPQWGEYTADDGVWAFNEFYPNRPKYLGKSYIEPFGIEARKVGKYEFDLVSTSGDPSWSLWRILYCCTLVPPVQEFVETVGMERATEDPSPGTTGPYTLERMTTGRVSYEAVPNHWRIQPTSERLVISHVPESAVRLAAVQAGRADLADRVEPADARRAQAAGLRIVQQPGWNARLVFGGVQALDNRGAAPWVTDVNVRRALALAIDEEALQETVGGGFGGTVDTIYSTVGMTKAPRYGYDPAEATRLLNEAGFPFDREITMPLITIGGAERAGQEHRALATMLEAIGLNTKIEVVGWGDWKPKWVSGDTDWMMWAFTTTTFVGEPLREWLMSTEEASTTTWTDETSTALFGDVTDTFIAGDDAAFSTAATSLGEYFYDNVLFVPLYVKPMLFALGENVLSWDRFGHHDGTRYDLIRVKAS